MKIRVLSPGGERRYLLGYFLINFKIIMKVEFVKKTSGVIQPLPIRFYQSYR